MSRNNDVFKVLVTTDNQDILAVGGTLDSLALGQIGIFDAKTNLAVDETATIVPQNIFFAVGVDKDGDTVKDDIEVSAGDSIQVRNTDQISYRPHTAGKDQIVNIVGYANGECDADYTVKFEFKNQEIYRRQGFTQFTKSFSVRTADCIGTEVDQDANKLSILLVDAINADETGVFSATIIARQAFTVATHGVSKEYITGDVMDVPADLDVIIAFNAANPGSEVYTDIQVTLTSLPLSNTSDVNLKYYKPRQTTVITSLLEDLVALGATVVEAQAVAFEEGKGYDVRQKEYHSQLNASGPYVLSESTGTAKENIFYSTVTENYDQFQIETINKSSAGWGEYGSPIRTIIAVPATNTITRNALAAALDVMFASTGLDTLASDVAAANVNPAVVEATEDKGFADDGLA